MATFDRIVVGVDGSDCSNETPRWTPPYPDDEFGAHERKAAA